MNTNHNERSSPSLNEIIASEQCNVTNQEVILRHMCDDPKIRGIRLKNLDTTEISKLIKSGCKVYLYFDQLAVPLDKSMDEISLLDDNIMSSERFRDFQLWKRNLRKCEIMFDIPRNTEMDYELEQLKRNESIGMDMYVFDLESALQIVRWVAKNKKLEV